MKGVTAIEWKNICQVHEALTVDYLWSALGCDHMLITVLKRLGSVLLGCHLSAGCCDHSDPDWMV